MLPSLPTPPGTPQQLPLPLVPPDCSSRARLSSTPTLVPPQAVWASLTPALRARVAQTLLRVAREVVRDVAHG
jgi:hypothetical protein